jgi:uroporphyrinogen III methyltransferase/synthase
MSVLGKVYLLGAGPGDPELITVRALRALESADVVLYDALVHRDQLARCRPGAEKIFVGKRAGRPSARQDAINEQMLHHARRGRTVARLKAGDPFLFGRGSEEALFLQRHGIAFEVVPGVPSPLAATAYAGLSLTHRGLASSVAYITATESDDKERTSHDWTKLATATQTLVIFMGVRRLRTQMQLLMRHGRPAHTPVAVIQWASTPQQRTVVGTVGDVADRVEAAGVSMPALTIVGEVVRLREQLRWFDVRPLFGKRVLVTRAQAQASALARHLRDAGAMPVEVATIRIVPPQDPRPLREAAGRLARYDAVLLTSPSAVEHLFGALAALGRDARAFASTMVCAIGPHTTEVLAARGIAADLVPRSSGGEELVQTLLATLADRREARVLLPRARTLRDTIPDRLRAAGLTVDDVIAYDTLPADAEETERIRALLRDRDVDVVAFTSSATVEGLLAILGPDERHQLDGILKASIGADTSATAAARGLPMDLTATSPSAAALVDVLVRHFSTVRSGG